jgi:hypothetical protein
MHRRDRTLCVFLIACIGIFASSSGFADAVSARVPSDSEVKVALQSVLVAYAATLAGTLVDPPIQFEESVYASDRSQSSIQLELSDADIGYLRKVVLESPNPLRQESTGFLDMLFRSALPLTPSYDVLVSYLKPQALKPGEVVFDGMVGAYRTAATYPFRYEGTGTLRVDGKRFKAPFVLEFSFRIPLEGPQLSTMVPLTVLANGADYLHVALQLFPQRPGPAVVR